MLSEKRNDIIEEQRKAREEYLKLKKMQQGEIKPQAKPSEVAIKPVTFKEKVQNYWYHFKVHTILIGAVVALLAILITQCANREKFDLTIMYFTYTPVIDSQLDAAEVYFEKYATDIDKNGEVNVNIINCSVSEDNRDAGRNTMFSKVQAVLVAEPEVVLYMVDDKSIEYFENAFDTNLFIEEPMILTKDFYVSLDEKLPLPDGLKLGLRVIDDTVFENNETAIKSFKEAKVVYEKVKKQNG
ncbi:MAG: hypothetical protein E7537_05415 [Ruminococcaceae bacterium]|nr:hypothetical protein [Oscillospiraceae bacterium]